MPDQIEKQVFRVDDDWSTREEREKKNIFNNVFKQRPLQLRKAREGMDALQDPHEDDASVIGWLYFFAYNTLNAAVNQGRIGNEDDDVMEKLEGLVDEFWNALKLRDGRELSPHDMKRESQWSQKNGRMSARLRDVMDERGGKIHQLIGFAFAGTQAVKEGGSDSQTRSMTDEEG